VRDDGTRYDKVTKKLFICGQFDVEVVKRRV